jgi:hypothetical protein
MKSDKDYYVFWEESYFCDPLKPAESFRELVIIEESSDDERVRREANQNQEVECWSEDENVISECLIDNQLLELFQTQLDITPSKRQAAESSMDDFFNQKMCCEQNCGQKFSKEFIVDFLMQSRTFTHVVKKNAMYSLMLAAQTVHKLKNSLLQAHNTTAMNLVSKLQLEDPDVAASLSPVKKIKCEGKKALKKKRKQVSPWNSDSVTDDVTSKRHFQPYLIGEELVCRTFFLFMFDVDKGVVESIIGHIKENGVKYVPFEERRGGNRKGHTPKHTVDCINFIRAHAKENGYANPSGTGLPFINKVTGSHEVAPADGIIFLHSSESKLEVFNKFRKLNPESAEFIKLSWFYNIWNEYCPHIRILKKGTDMCDTCNDLRLSKNAVTQAFLISHREKAVRLKLHGDLLMKNAVESFNTNISPFKFGERQRFVERWRAGLGESPNLDGRDTLFLILRKLLWCQISRSNTALCISKFLSKCACLVFVQHLFHASSISCSLKVTMPLIVHHLSSSQTQQAIWKPMIPL